MFPVSLLRDKPGLVPVPFCRGRIVSNLFLRVDLAAVELSLNFRVVTLRFQDSPLKSSCKFDFSADGKSYALARLKVEVVA